jgi:ATP-dependent Lhr-like helicase
MTQRRQLDPVEVFEHAYDVVAQHIAGMALVGDWEREELYRLITRSYPLRNLPREEFEEILIYLEGGGRSLKSQYEKTFGRIIIEGDVIKAVPDARRRRDYLMNVGTIPSEGSVAIKLHTRTIGTVEEMFIKKLNIGDVFVLGGRIVKLVKTGIMEAKVEAADHLQPTVPAWHANKMPLSSGLAREVTRVRTDLERLLAREGRGLEEVADWLVENFELSLTNAQAIARHFLMQSKYSAIPIAERLLIEVFEEEGLLHYFFHSLIGRSANDALSRIVSLRVKNRVGGNAMVTIDDYGFLLTLKEEQALELEDWRELFTPESAEDDLVEALRDSELVKWQFRGIAQTGLMVPRQVPGRERRLKQLRWSGELLFQVLQRHEPGHPLMRQAYYEAMHTFLNAPLALEYLEAVGKHEWLLRKVPAVTPFSFGMYVSKIKESMMLEDPDAAIERMFRSMYETLENRAEAVGGLEG